MPNTDSTALAAGVRVSAVSVFWTVLSSAAAIVIGFVTDTLVLVAFGLTGLLDAAGSVTLIVHFRHTLRHDVVSERHEQLALRVITAGLVVVGVATAIESVRRLVVGSESRSGAAGLLLAAASAVALAVLAGRKRTIARRLESRALLADSWLSATGCLLAIVTVAGTGLASRLGWWWADPVAALAVAVGAVAVARVFR